MIGVLMVVLMVAYFWYMIQFERETNRRIKAHHEVMYEMMTWTREDYEAIACGLIALGNEIAELQKKAQEKEGEDV